MNRERIRIEDFSGLYEPQCLLGRFAGNYWGPMALQYRLLIGVPFCWSDSLFYSKASKSKSWAGLPSLSTASSSFKTCRFTITAFLIDLLHLNFFDARELIKGLVLSQKLHELQMVTIY